jgi:hypothetical protein
VTGSRDFDRDYENTILLGLAVAVAEVQQAGTAVGDEGASAEEGGGDVRDEAERRDVERSHLQEAQGMLEEVIEISRAPVGQGRRGVALTSASKGLLMIERARGLLTAVNTRLTALLAEDE